MRRTFLLLLPLLAALHAAPAAAQQVARVDVVDSRFRVILTDGRVRHSDQLVGAILTIGVGNGAVRVRIDAVERDTTDYAADVWLHSLSVEGADGRWSTHCTPDVNGRRLAFPVAGQAARDGILATAEPGRMEILCTSGAMAKCARFGYRPWAAAPDGTSLLTAHRACVRMLRGDYGGRDEPMTRDGMQINVSDALGIQALEDVPDMAFEAGWGPDGAVCVHHPRVKENVTLEELEARYPRLKGRTGSICTEQFARAQGAVIFNHSRR
jgi:hypothetical protein